MWASNSQPALIEAQRIYLVFCFKKIVWVYLVPRVVYLDMMEELLMPILKEHSLTDLPF
jgi:hypothetical protein